ncbi:MULTISPECIES: helix-turn-helix domain-containing protein [unclassified Streptomyces]|uniref:PucR family transcriptional regulator n=1 Tax=unclassified Streptomyces TaxID=2593676 RepID=UPI001BED17D1|nr:MULTISPECIES: helix-turn-helix domain-containing protein [unclassified Streptomyces]MBT2407856.1 helix-turn-helix domain-containing protein [Streptomyces sp. ISL-21]MBT2457374.1 helix-turn-helix domain-containing protein [Streptomyces sp. ISL-86]MBT2608454.1 helix-turn-helix domain-containing protein [Streptomyces sp. ISL-87]
MAGRDIPEDHLDGFVRILAEVCETGRRLTREELESRRAVGERAAEAGFGLRALVRQHLSTTRTACPDLPRAPLDRVLAAVEQVVDALAEGHERAQLVAVRKEEAARREFIDDLLYGRSDPGRLAERAERFGLLLSHTHAVAVAEGAQAYDDIHPAVQRVERALVGRFGNRRILLTTKEGRLICVAPADQDDVLMYFAKQAHAGTDGGRVAIGRPHAGAGGVVHSYEEALNALELADRMHIEDPVLRASDLLVYPVLTRDRQAMADLVLSTLGPLTQARGGAGPMLETLIAYFDSGCNATEAARRLSLSVRAFTYRLERIHQFTGANPADPAHRYTLQTAVIGARLFDWPAKDL